MSQTIDRSDAERLARIANALSEPARAQMAALLLDRGEVRPMVLRQALKEAGTALAQPTTSHHLRMLVVAGLANSRSVGIAHYYQLTPLGNRVVRAFLVSAS